LEEDHFFYAYYVSELVLLVLSIYFIYIAVMSLARQQMSPSIFSSIIGLLNFLAPGILMIIFLGLQQANGLRVDEPTTTVEAQILAYASLSLWLNLAYFARIWESTGMYIVLFK
jgi:hypothetical protein